MPSDERPQSPERASLTEVTEARASRALLEEGGLTVIGQLPGASNTTLLVRLDHNGSSALAVAKPEAGESPLWDFPTGTLYRREVAAWELASMLGWPNIPETVIRHEEALGGASAVQAFIPHDPSQHAFTLEESFADALRAVALFDVVANNADRKGGHVLRDADDVLWSIDHGICFAAGAKLRTVLWGFAGEPISERARSDLSRVHATLNADSALSQLLDPAEMDALRARFAHLLDDPRFPPQPHLRPSVPWPPV